MDGLWEKIRLVKIAITRFSIKEFKNTDLGYKTNNLLLKSQVKVLKPTINIGLAKPDFFFVILA